MAMGTTKVSSRARARTWSTTTTMVRMAARRTWLGADLQRQICLLEDDQDGDVVGEPSLEEDDDAHQYVDEEFLESSGQETHGFCDDEMLHEEIVEERSHLCNGDELPESPITGYGLEEGGSDADGTSNSNDMVYMINKVMVLAVAMTWST
ncbi:myosin-binding protein 7-like [Hordeum vulgare]|nr:myosin-binding protein 7-like [Hordeum vulgare]